MSRILLTGAKGQVGSEVEEKLLFLGYSVISCGHDDLDIGNEKAVTSMFESVDFDLVINCAAYTAVDKAEDENALCYEVNALGAKNLALGCRAKNIPLIHISTDYVYDNSLPGFHKEDETPNTRCVYGRTKLFGERFISDSGCNAVILRASWIFGRYGRNFVKTMARLAKDRDELTVVSDERGNPTPARALSDAVCSIAKMILSGDFTRYGTYNFCGVRDIFRNEFAQYIVDKALELGLIDHKVRVNAITSAEYGAKAVRPLDSRMSTELFENTFGIRAPLWSDYIEETLRG